MNWKPDSFFLGDRRLDRMHEINNFSILNSDFEKLEKISKGICNSIFRGYDEIINDKGLPNEWSKNGNKIFVPSGGAIPLIRYHEGLPPPRNARIFLSGRSDFSLMVWGTPFMYMAPNIRHPRAQFYIGDGFVFMADDVRSNGNLTINCRNNGNIVFDGDALIANDVVVMTDDCHTIISKFNMNRINPYGGTVWIREHVWLGMRSQIMGNTKVNRDTIVGANSFLRNSEYPESTIIAGMPAQVVKEGVTWDSRDIPPN